MISHFMARNNLKNSAKMLSKNSKKGDKMEVYDLEITSPKEPRNPHFMRQDLLNTLKPFASKPLVNKHDGRVAYISEKKIGKFGSGTALDVSKRNGFSEAQHFEVAKHLPELYQNAHLREIQLDLKNGDLNVRMPRYEIAFTLDGNIVVAKITLKETLNGIFKGNKLYTIELESIVKLSSNGL